MTSAIRAMNIWTVRDLFLAGMDTLDIAKRFGKRECLVCDALFQARAMERQVRVLGHKKNDIGL